MRLWPRRRWADPDTGRDENGRVYDGDTVRRDGQARWADLLDHGALTERTQLLGGVAPMLTRAQQHRTGGGGSR